MGRGDRAITFAWPTLSSEEDRPLGIAAVDQEICARLPEVERANAPDRRSISRPTVARKGIRYRHHDWVLPRQERGGVGTLVRSDDSPKRRVEQVTSLPFAFEHAIA
jgi:hypothetical protein